MNTDKKDVIIACDFSFKEDLFNFLLNFKDEKPFLKIGMEIFYKYGPYIVKELKNLGFVKIFLDLKLCDIPNTVQKAVSNLINLEVNFISVHAFGGVEMLKKAKQATLGSNTKILGVTILTSISESSLENELFIKYDIKKAVLKYGKNIINSGLDGIISSPLEVPNIKKINDKVLCITPGIRYDINSKNDQFRTANPAEAKKLGSDYIVIGRVITESNNPLELYKKIKNEFIK